MKFYFPKKPFWYVDNAAYGILWLCPYYIALDHWIGSQPRAWSFFLHSLVFIWWNSLICIADVDEWKGAIHATIFVPSRIVCNENSLLIFCPNFKSAYLTHMKLDRDTWLVVGFISASSMHCRVSIRLYLQKVNFWALVIKFSNHQNFL